MLLFIYL